MRSGAGSPAFRIHDLVAKLYNIMWTWLGQAETRPGAVSFLAQSLRGLRAQLKNNIPPIEVIAARDPKPLYAAKASRNEPPEIKVNTAAPAPNKTPEMMNTKIKSNLTFP